MKWFQITLHNIITWWCQHEDRYVHRPFWGTETWETLYPSLHSHPWRWLTLYQTFPAYNISISAGFIISLAIFYVFLKAHVLSAILLVLLSITKNSLRIGLYTSHITRNIEKWQTVPLEVLHWSGQLSVVLPRWVLIFYNIGDTKLLWAGELVIANTGSQGENHLEVLDFLLWQGYPWGWPRKASSCNIFGFQKITFLLQEKKNVQHTAR